MYIYTKPVTATGKIFHFCGGRVKGKGDAAGISVRRKFKFKRETRISFLVVLFFVLSKTDFDAFIFRREGEGREGGSGGSPATVSRGEELSKMEKKHGSPIKSIFYGRATGRVTTMANNNTLLWAHPTNVTPTPRDDYPRVTRCTGWFIAIIFLFSGSPPMKWAVLATGGGGKRIGRAEEDTGGHTGTYA